MINRVILMGRLCADPEFRQTAAGTPSCRFRIAINRPKGREGVQEADFISIVCWRQKAEFVSRYFRKGSMILIEGQMRNNDYTDNSGQKHYQIEVLAEEVHFCESKPQNPDAAQGAAPAGNAPAGYPQSAPPQPYPQPYPGQTYPAPVTCYAPPPQFDAVPDYRTNQYPRQK